jgi:hypothetical protein
MAVSPLQAESDEELRRQREAGTRRAARLQLRQVLQGR